MRRRARRSALVSSGQIAGSITTRRTGAGSAVALGGLVGALASALRRLVGEALDELPEDTELAGPGLVLAGRGDRRAIDHTLRHEDPRVAADRERDRVGRAGVDLDLAL